MKSKPRFTSEQLEVLFTKNAAAAKKAAPVKITSFKAKNANGKIYLRWNVENLKKKGVFMVYRSCDGKLFDTIGSRLAENVPFEQQEQGVNYFTDETGIKEGAKHYRIVFIGGASECLVSEKISVENENVMSKNGVGK